MNNKDVIYVDVEDEITNIIDKVNTSKSKVVALVLPKRATVFQSIVNMKLLKKKATDAKKRVVLVTSEASLLPLAGVVGVHIAKSLQAQPEIPPNPNVDLDNDSPVNLSDDEPEEPKEIDHNAPIGELAGLAAVGSMVSRADEPDNIEIDNDALPRDELGLDAIDNDGQTKKTPKNKKLKKLSGKTTKIPDFDRFRKWLLIGLGVIILLVVFYIVGYKILPKATIIVQTNTSNVSSDLTLTLTQANQNLDPSSDTVPAKLQTATKTSTSTSVPTTGTKAIGTSASGTITITNKDVSTSTDVPAGTMFTDSSGNFSFTANTDTTIPGCSVFHGICSHPGTDSVTVTATAIGTSYNINSTSYTSSDSSVNAFSSSQDPADSIQGSSMSGGSSSNVQVVAQADISSAESQLSALNGSEEEQQLENSLTQQGYMPIPATYVAGTPVYTPSAVLGAQANSITVNESVTYTMYGAKQSDLNTLVVNNVNQSINPSTQSILDSGISGANFTQQSTTSTSDQVTMQTNSTVGPKLDTSAIASQSAGKKSGDIESAIAQTPGVTNVSVKYSPFWITSTPSSVKKITVVIEKANGSQP
jgi:hypothetical protein